MNLEPTLSFALTPELAVEEAARLKKVSPFSKPEELLRGSRYQRQAGVQLRADSVTALKGSKILPEGLSVVDYAGTVVAEFFYADETYFVLHTGDLVNWDADLRESEARIYAALTEGEEKSVSDNEVKED
jgi:hypothetical protein